MKLWRSLQAYLILLMFVLSFCRSLATTIALSIDDFAMRDSEILTLEEQDERILAALKKHSIKAAAFVTTRHLQNKRIKARFHQWDEAGHLIANHTHKHANYHKVSFKQFSQDILQAEKYLTKYKNFQKLFRFPYLKGGNTLKKRDRMRRFLKQHGYQNGYVTIDASDWYISSRLEKKLKSTPKISLTVYREYYLNHLWERATYYNSLAQKYLKRTIPHTLLIHHNLLNALFLEAVIQMFKDRGWNVISAKTAFQDPLFSMQTNTIPAGESILWSIAKAHGDKTLSYPGENSLKEKKQMDALKL